jgi:hypothetical protein
MQIRKEVRFGNLSSVTVSNEVVGLEGATGEISGAGQWVSMGTVV